MALNSYPSFFKPKTATAMLFFFACLVLLVMGVNAQLNWFEERAQNPEALSQSRGNASPRGPSLSSRSGVPTWEIDNRFDSDVFTFVRIEYDSYFGRSHWKVDYPAADLNFSYRLEELTSMKVNPDGKILRLGDAELNNYPFIFMIDARNIFLSENDSKILKNYLESGGFLLMDDLWGNKMLKHISRQLEKVFPKKQLVELPLDHEIFNGVYILDQKPQVPSEDAAHDGAPYGITWETNIYRAVDQQNPRIAAMIGNIDEESARRRSTSLLYLSMRKAGRKSLIDKFPQINIMIVQLDVIMQNCAECFQTRRNRTLDHHLYFFRKQKASENLHQFWNTVIGLATKCDFGNQREGLVHDILIFNYERRRRI